MNRIIVTGGNGFIGRHLVKKLLSRNEYSVIIISNKPNVADESTAKEDSKLRFHTADIRDGKTISKIIRDERADICIHLAAKINVPDSIKNPEETMEVNAKGTLNVLKACHNGQVGKFIFASSAAVYGDVTNLPISEDNRLRPLSPYGASKMLAERHVRKFSALRKIKKSISLRFFNVYGPGQPAGGSVVAKFAERLSKGLAPVISGDGTHTRDFIFIDDVVDSILFSMEAMAEPINNPNYDLTSSVFNIATGTATSINELASKMICISGLELDPLYVEEKSDSGVILHSYADTKKAKKALSFIARKNLDTGLKEIIQSKRVSKGTSQLYTKN